MVPSAGPGAVSLLIVYVNSSVGIALAQRLVDAADVSLSPVPEALEALERGSRHDVVVLCPYLAADEREALLSACDAGPTSPTVLEIADTVESPGAHVRVARTGRTPIEPLLATLSLPLGS